MTTAAAPDHVRGNLLRYARWQLTDYLLERGAGTMLVMVLAGYLIYASTRGLVASAPDAAAIVGQVAFKPLLGQLMFLGALFATNGIVSDDRKNGFYRFYFAKPVDPARFYVQRLAVEGAGFAVLSALLLAAFQYAFHFDVPPQALGVIMAGFVLFGGVGFLISSLVRTDWLWFVLTYFVTMLSWQRWGRVSDWRRGLAWLLPPLHEAGIGRLEDLVARGLPLDWGTIAWVVGYGLACIAAGMLVLRRRHLGGS